ncbi:hypothetical protein [Duganella sp. HH105]|uniref:hypothetical protein n=1 Tax=Duganella sp. HH105 TaxID=1781067 RepID=UPI000893A97B|nr:hypothetical protein [Duganella sp. HH105]OEZ58192.1 hypothetical protein DUGA6_41560 [Duganella sp. HH105]
MWPFTKRKERQQSCAAFSFAEVAQVAPDRETAPQSTRQSLRAEEILKAYDESRDVLAPTVKGGLVSRNERQRLYKLLLMLPAKEYGNLTRQAFAEEVQYRAALWSGTTEDDGDCYEGIYRCAFLLYRIGDPADIATLWSAKYMNMDVGTSMGAEFFMGPGLQAVVQYLEKSSLEDSEEISEYIKGWACQDNAERWQRDWEDEMASNILSARE